MNMRDLHTRILLSEVIGRTAIAAAGVTASTLIDRMGPSGSGYHGLEVACAVALSAAGTLTLGLTEGNAADGSDQVAVDPAMLILNPASAGENVQSGIGSAVLSVGYQGACRYIKATLTAVGGSVAGTVDAGIAILHDPFLGVNTQDLNVSNDGADIAPGTGSGDDPSR